MDKPERVRWSLVGQFVLSLLAIAVCWSLAAGLVIWGGFVLIAGRTETGDPLQVFMMAGSLAASGLLLLPAAYYALMGLLGENAPDSRTLISRLHPGRWILGLPVVLLLGHWVSGNPELSWLMLPPLHLLAVGIPTVWMLYLAIRKLPTGSSRRLWGVFGSGLTLAPVLIMILEILAAVGMGLLAAVYLVSQPALIEQIAELVTRLKGIETQEAAMEILGPLLVQPAVIAGVLFFGSVVVPLVEELLKPIGVWLLVGRKISPAAGFAAGALSGAGYAFVESLLLSGSGEQWSAAVLARSGTAAIHILTTALTGWALVQAWQQRRFLRLFLAYLCAVLIHGLWNGLTLLYTVKVVAELQGFPLEIPMLQGVGLAAPFGLILLAAGCFFGLIAANQALQRRWARPASTTLAAVPEEESDESML